MPDILDTILEGAGQSVPRSAAQPDYRALTRQYAAQYGIDPDIVERQFNQESRYNPKAISPKGARGIAQLMPGTASEVARELGETYNPDDAEQNIRFGVHYLAKMLKRFGGDYAKGLAAYNAGPGAVEKYNGVPPYKETQNYKNTILGQQGSQPRRRTQVGPSIGDTILEGISSPSQTQPPAQPQPAPAAPASPQIQTPYSLNQDYGANLLQGLSDIETLASPRRLPSPMSANQRKAQANAQILSPSEQRIRHDLLQNPETEFATRPYDPKYYDTAQQGMVEAARKARSELSGPERLGADLATAMARGSVPMAQRLANLGIVDQSGIDQRKLALDVMRQAQGGENEIPSAVAEGITGAAPYMVAGRFIPGILPNAAAAGGLSYLGEGPDVSETDKLKRAAITAGSAYTGGKLGDVAGRFGGETLGAEALRRTGAAAANVGVGAATRAAMGEDVADLKSQIAPAILDVGFGVMHPAGSPEHRQMLGEQRTARQYDRFHEYVNRFEQQAQARQAKPPATAEAGQPVVAPTVPAGSVRILAEGEPLAPGEGRTTIRTGKETYAVAHPEGMAKAEVEQALAARRDPMNRVFEDDLAHEHFQRVATGDTSPKAIADLNAALGGLGLKPREIANVIRQARRMELESRPERTQRSVTQREGVVTSQGRYARAEDVAPDLPEEVPRTLDVPENIGSTRAPQVQAAIDEWTRIRRNPPVTEVQRVLGVGPEDAANIKNLLGNRIAEARRTEQVGRQTDIQTRRTERETQAAQRRTEAQQKADAKAQAQAESRALNDAVRTGDIEGIRRGTDSLLARYQDAVSSQDANEAQRLYAAADASLGALANRSQGEARTRVYEDRATLREQHRQFRQSLNENQENVSPEAAVQPNRQKNQAVPAQEVSRPGKVTAKEPNAPQDITENLPQAARQSARMADESADQAAQPETVAREATTGRPVRSRADAARASAYEKLGTDDPVQIGEIFAQSSRRNIRKPMSADERATIADAAARVDALAPEEKAAISAILPPREYHPPGQHIQGIPSSQLPGTEPQAAANLRDVTRFFGEKQRTGQSEPSPPVRSSEDVKQRLAQATEGQLRAETERIDAEIKRLSGLKKTPENRARQDDLGHLRNRVEAELMRRTAERTADTVDTSSAENAEIAQALTRLTEKNPRFRAILDKLSRNEELDQKERENFHRIASDAVGKNRAARLVDLALAQARRGRGSVPQEAVSAESAEGVAGRTPAQGERTAEAERSGVQAEKVTQPSSELQGTEKSTAVKPKGRKKAQAAESPAADTLRTLRDNADVQQGGLMSLTELRAQSKLSKPEFDDLMLRAYREGAVDLTRHHHPASLSPEARAALVESPELMEGTKQHVQYNAATVRKPEALERMIAEAEQGNAPSAKPKKGNTVAEKSAPARPLTGKLGKGDPQSGATFLFSRPQRPKVDVPPDFNPHKTLNSLDRTISEMAKQERFETPEARAEFEKQTFALFDKLTEAYDRNDGAAFDKAQAELVTHVAKHSRNTAQQWGDVAGLARSTSFTGDLALLRNLGNLALLHPGKFVKIALKGGDAMLSQESYHVNAAKLHADGLWGEAKDAGLGTVTDNHKYLGLEAGFFEETPGGRLIEKLPLLRNIERANRVMIDEGRLTIYKNLRSGEKADDPKYQQAVAAFANAVTGRGSRGGNSRILGLLTSPRYMYSFVDQFVQGAKVIRQNPAAAPKVAGYLTGRMAAVALMHGAAAALLGGTILTDDPDNADFLKVKIGENRLDFSGGAIPYYRLGVRLYKLATASDRPQAAKEREAYRILKDFMMARIAPVERAFLQSGSDSFSFENAGLNVKNISSLVSTFAPLFLQSFAKNLTTQGLKPALAHVPLNIAGVNSDIYDTRKQAIPALTEGPLAQEYRRLDVNPARVRQMSKGVPPDPAALKYLRREGDYEQTPVMNRISGKPKPALESRENFEARVRQADEMFRRYGNELISHPRYQAMEDKSKQAALTHLANQIEQATESSRTQRISVSEIIRNALDRERSSPRREQEELRKLSPDIRRVREAQLSARRQ